MSKAARDIAGTAPYMAPEQWNGDPLDGKCDQYALAMVAYQLIAGKLPWDVTSEIAWMNCALSKEPEPIEGISRSCSNAVLKGCAKSPDQRFRLCCDMVTTWQSTYQTDIQRERKSPSTSGVACWTSSSAAIDALKEANAQLCLASSQRVLPEVNHFDMVLEQLVRTGKKTEAIKKYRERTNTGSSNYLGGWASGPARTLGVLGSLGGLAPGKEI